LGHQARDLDVVLLDNNASLDAILGAPNYNINNFLIIRYKNITKKPIECIVLSNKVWFYYK
jgi:hypothetical protein